MMCADGLAGTAAGDAEYARPFRSSQSNMANRKKSGEQKRKRKLKLESTPSLCRHTLSPPRGSVKSAFQEVLLPAVSHASLAAVLTTPSPYMEVR